MNIHLEPKTLRSIIAALLLLPSCGDVSSKVRGTQDEVKKDSLSSRDDVRLLNLEDPSCQNQSASIPITSATIYEWDGRSVNPKTVIVNAGPGTNGEFSTKNIPAAVLNFEKSSNCTLDGNGLLRCSQTTVQNPKGQLPLKLCRQNGTYKRDSLEAVSLTATYTIEKSYDFYASIPGAKTGLPKSYLIPQIKSVRSITNARGQTATLVDSDNASFGRSMTSSGGEITGLLTLYPTSNTFFRKSNVNFWEVPFILQHEFGHLVLDHYLSSAISALGLSITRYSRDRDTRILPMPGEQEIDFKLTESDIPKMAFDGVHELFADLFAYFAGGSSDNQLTGVVCLESSRDPSIAKTKSGANKGIDQNRIDIYEGRKNSSKTKSDCGEPDYSDAHDIAAGLGYPIAVFVKKAITSSDGSSAAKLLFNWAESMAKLADQSPSKVSTDSLVKELILQARALPGSLNDACNHLKPLITGLPLSTAACAE